MELIAVPFTPTYAEYIYLKDHRVRADQMQYLLDQYPALESPARCSSDRPIFSGKDVIDTHFHGWDLA